MAVAGLRGTGSWSTDERPKNYREVILYLYPNGSSPLMGMLGKLSDESTDDPEFKVFIKGLPGQRALVNAAGYNNTDNPVTITFKTAGDYKMFKAGHSIINERTLEVMWVNSVSDNAAVCKRAVGGQALTAGVADDGLLIVGSHHAEGVGAPSAIMYDPSVITNYTQIFRNSLEQTNTARATHLRTGDQYKNAQRECLQLHNIEMEKAFLFGVGAEITGTNGQPERGTKGMIFHITSNVKDWTAGVDIDSFEDWCEDLFRYGSNEKMWLGGAKTINVLNKLARINGHIELAPEKTTYGMDIQRWLTPFGRLNLKLHPLFSENATFNKWAFIFDMPQLRYRYLKGRDTRFLANRQAPDYDTVKDEYITECGLEGRFEQAHGLCKNMSAAII